MLQHTIVLSFFMRQGVFTEVKAFSNIVMQKVIWALAFRWVYTLDVWHTAVCR